MSATARDRMVKVTIPLHPDAWHGKATETVWSESVGGDKYRIANVPFFATGLSYGDVVTAQIESEALVLREIVLRSGHSTYRLFLSDAAFFETTEFKNFWAPLAREGCTFERATERLFAVDVPPRADIHKVYASLERGEEKGVWSFEEGHCAHGV